MLVLSSLQVNRLVSRVGDSSRAEVGLNFPHPSMLLHKRGLETGQPCPAPSEQYFLLKVVAFSSPLMVMLTLLVCCHSFCRLPPILKPLVAAARLLPSCFQLPPLSFVSLILVADPPHPFASRRNLTSRS